MKTKKVKRSKPKKPLTQATKVAAEPKAEAGKENGFEKSRALSHQEIVELKEHLEDLNRSNTSGG